MSSGGRGGLERMTTQTHPGRQLFVTLPVADVDRSRAFFAELGFSFDPRFSGEDAVCMLVGEQVSVMLGTRERVGELSKRPLADPATHALALFSFSVGTREEVDTVAATALAGGGTEADEAEDHGFMYTRAFFDLDGHGWQVMWMAPAESEAAPE
jgi:predicted lactoylglutathione lyase